MSTGAGAGGSGTLVIADDHPIFRAGLRALLEQRGLTVLAEASDGVAAQRIAERLRPDWLLLDIAMPKRGGLQVLEQLGGERAQPRCVMLTLYDDRAYLSRALALGARGYLLKDDAIDELPRCLDAVAGGDRYISRRLRPTAGPLPASGLDRLSRREREVLVLIAMQLSSQDIALRLALSVRTVDNHRYSIGAKLGLTGNNALLKWALTHRALIEAE